MIPDIRTTPRPWFADYGKIGSGDRGIGEMDWPEDGDLVVEAVNDYDRLRKIEAAARRLTRGHPDEEWAALRAALSGEVA